MTMTKPIHVMKEIHTWIMQIKLDNDFRNVTEVMTHIKSVYESAEGARRCAEN